ncbi:MAG: ECF transporter S component [Anaerovoracaceae bacterium]|jgi:energy-coupling factor transporter ATP-binding protein EcfA2/uncharacterized membrane protein
MEAFAVRDLTFTYAEASMPAVRDVTFSVDRGEFVLLCGKSGCGKTTLLRNLKSVLAPHGTRSGSIMYMGRPIDSVSEREQASSIGFVLQDPDNQIVTDKVWHELAFGLESLGMDNRTIRMRVAETATYFGLQSRFEDKVSELSGGGKQLLNLAAVTAMRPDVLILDEPASQLDPSAASDLFDMLKKLNLDTGMTVIMTEHRLDEVMPQADRVIIMDEGRIVADGTPAEAGRAAARGAGGMLLSMPAPVRIYSELSGRGIGENLACPVDVREGRKYLDRLLSGREIIKDRLPEGGAPDGGETAVSVKSASFRYERDSADVIKGLDLEVRRGEIYALVGGNGTGKTTTLRILGGKLRPYKGKIKTSGTVGMLPQDAQTVFGSDTVEKDLLASLEGIDISKEEKSGRVRKAAEEADIGNLLDRHPYDLSGGEQQRAALAKVLLTEPDILLLDEPTKGIDNEFKAKLAGVLSRLACAGMTVIIVSHDIEFCAQYADRCGMFFNGQITAEGSPREFFSGNSFYTTSANRMSRHVFINAVTAADVAELVSENTGGPEGSGGGDASPINDTTGNGSEGPGSGSAGGDPGEDHVVETRIITENSAGTGKRAALTLGAVVFAALTLMLGIKYGHSRSYYIVSMLIVLYGQVPFFLMFERKRPHEREVVVTAVLVTLGVLGNAIFFAAPEIKPSAAITLIAGACLGPETGFVTGSLIPLITNFMFGQGPWTPWQMFAMGMVGLIAGLILNNDRARSSNVLMCIYGFIAAFAIYGGIVDINTIFAMTPEPTLATVLGVYGTALPINTIFGIATVIFTALLAKPMISKIERIKKKFGLAVQNYSSNT